jgi:hypothetical protein
VPQGKPRSRCVQATGGSDIAAVFAAVITDEVRG